MSRTLLLLLGIWLAVAAGERVRYDNYRVYQVSAVTTNQLKSLQDLEGSSDSIIFLEAPYVLSKTLNVVVAPHKVSDFVNVLVAEGITYKLTEENVRRRLDEEDIGISSRAGYDWSSYHTLEETYSWLESLAETYPNQVSMIVGGTTYENREIKGIKISYKPGNNGIFIEGGIHAREWISPATVTFLINALLTSTFASVRNIAENNDWYIFPHVNPDGYVYTWTDDRMWRKTRQPYGDCFGADPNRNWDFFWNTAGSSDNPCSDSYAGPSANSEIEIKSLSSYVASLKGKIQLYVSFHSYSQLLLYPYGHTGELPENVNDIKTVYNAAIAAISKKYGTMYTGGSIYHAIYPASGSSIDWAYANVDTKLAFSYELRPSGYDAAGFGFQLPASQIIPAAGEALDSIVAMVGKAKELKYL